jgi:hypothetical protein
MSAAERDEAWLLVPDCKALFAVLAAVWATHRTGQIELAKFAANEGFEVRKAETVLSRDAVVRNRHL